MKVAHILTLAALGISASVMADDTIRSKGEPEKYGRAADDMAKPSKKEIYKRQAEQEGVIKSKGQPEKFGRAADDMGKPSKKEIYKRQADESKVIRSKGEPEKFGRAVADKS
jgi:hypothetical protein